MSAILEIPEVRRRVSRLSVEEYHRLNEFNDNGRRTELIRGIVIEKTSKSPLHCSIAKRLYDTIARLLPKGFIVRHEAPITLADSEPEPDIAVMCGAEADFSRRIRRRLSWWLKWQFPARRWTAKTPRSTPKPG